MGGGDGGIQDALRFATNGLSCRSIIKAIEAKTGPACGGMLEQLHSLQDQEEMAQRAFACDPAMDVVVQPLLNRRYQSAIDAVYASSERADRIKDALKELVKFPNVSLFYPDESLSRCFGLNRFLALLFDRHFRNAYAAPFLRPFHKAAGVFCDHDQGAPCSSQPHSVRFDNPPGEITCNILVPRIGLDTRKMLDRPSRAHAISETLPSWLPDWAPTL